MRQIKDEPDQVFSVLDILIHIILDKYTLRKKLAFFIILNDTPQGVKKTYQLVRQNHSFKAKLLNFLLWVDYFIADLVFFSGSKNFDFNRPKSNFKTKK